MNLHNYNHRGRTVASVLLLAVLLLSAYSAIAAAQEPVKFVAHRVGRFRSEACAVGDFNNDGKLDIVAGPYWYESPDWKPHLFRALEGKADDKGKTYSVDEKGAGYWDDFMNLAMDVDGDGLQDVVTCCWFSKQLDWYRNIGPNAEQWPMTVSDKNGNYECGELWDIDGDGRKLEILPDTQDTKWYEIGVTKEGKRGLVRHDVSSNQKLFGGGVGDINGDGHPDILRPDAWYEAPADPRKGQWKEHPLAVGSLTEGQAEHTPQIQVYDIDDDGLNDILTSSAHGHGIFWYKQTKDGAARSWKQHVIDKSWSQAHSIILADMDGDGDLDFVTGKRFLAHNGNDPDAHSPLGVYWYELRRGDAVRWVKHVISFDEGIGSGLSIPVVDLDGDGDLDIVVTGKWGGPVYFENTAKSN
ncbi:MAG: VCBS repeat-containing protein [Planctomycetota bacterium]